MSEAMIEVDMLNKSFDKHKILQDITFTCKAGEIVGFVGYNGSGKSVLFKCICGLLKPDSGKICIHSSKADNKKSVYENMGIIIEEPAFLRNKSGIKNLEFLYGIRNEIDKTYLFSVMEQVGLDPLDKKYVGKYSLGMKQRLAIAQATMENQEILILDEPMNGLDRKGAAHMRAFFLELKKQGRLILLASHNREDIVTLCDRVFEIDGGRLILMNN